MTLAHRMARIKPSATLAITQKAAELKRQGRDVLTLSTGEPDFDTPDFIKEAAIDAIHKGFTKYTAVDGILPLKMAIQLKFKKDNGLDFGLNEIIVSSGGKQCCYNLLQALINPGDEVIVPAPYWVSYPDMVYLAGGDVRVVGTGADFKMTPEQLERAIGPRTKLLIVNSPSNPTGVAYRPEEWGALAAVLKRHPQVWVATDDMYEHIWWADFPFSNLLMVAPELRERTVILHGVSKTYAMTGWRIGYAAGPHLIIEAMGTIQSQSTSNPNSIAQVAAQAALNGDQSVIREMVVTFKRRHDFLYNRLNAIPDLGVTPADGTFYLFPDCRRIIEKWGMRSDLELSEYLLTQFNLAVVPGSAFGAPGCVRLSYATSDDILSQAAERLETAFGLTGVVK